MNLLLKKRNNFLMQDKINKKRSEHKKKLKEVRVSRLEKQLKANILKRKKGNSTEILSGLALSSGNQNEINDFFRTFEF